MSSAFNMLVLTDHAGHSAENSLYALLQQVRRHPACASVDVASRTNTINDPFFRAFSTGEVHVSSVDEDFSFSADGNALQNRLRLAEIDNYEVIWLRMPPPLSKAFLNFLDEILPNTLIINSPKGIYQTGSKSFLTNFADLCPPMKICRSVEDIAGFKSRFPIVLKPFREYGGKGIVRIDGDRVWEGKQEMTFDQFVARINPEQLEYLAVKFLKNIAMGDKRIVVVDGKIMGASLRLPAKDSWLCNVAMGGHSNYTEADRDEIRIVERIDPVLSEMGILMYGVDTLVGDDGRRVLSEINTTSIGGLPQIAKLSGEPRLQQAIDLICKYILKNLIPTNAQHKS